MTQKMKTNGDFDPPQIQDLGDRTYFYNFNVEKRTVGEGNESYDTYDYDQVRLPYPVDAEAIQAEVDAQGFDHIVILE